MIKKLSLIFSLVALSSCTDYSDVAESTELLVTKGYHNIDIRYVANSDDTAKIRSLCNYNTTIVFSAKDSKNQSKTLAVCVDTRKVHLLSQSLD